MKKFILIDAYALIHRAYHALPPLSTKSGEVVNAVFGFASILIKTLGEFKPDYAAAVFDMAEPTFRHKEYKEYKATRPSAPPDLYAQIPRVKEILEAFGIPIYEKAGYEADDIIGAISGKAAKENIETLILTGDLDTLQLVGGNVKVYTPKRGLSDSVIYDEKKVAERFGGLKPGQLNDFKGLKGDPSDNIPGVKGIGEKTAIDLLARYGTIEGIYETIERGDDSGIGKSVLEKLKVGKESAFFSRKMATLHPNVPIKFLIQDAKIGDFNEKKLFGILKNLGFVSLIERIKSVSGVSNKQQMLVMPDQKISSDLNGLKKKLETAKEIYLSYKIDENKKLKILAIGAGDGVYFLNKNFAAVGSAMADPNIKKIGHDFKLLIKALHKENVEIGGIYFDAAIAAYVLNPGDRDYSLEKIILKEFGEAVSADSDGAAGLKISALKKLKPILSARLTATETEKVFEEIEMPLIPVLAEMEEAGIKLDGEKLKKISVELNAKIKELERSIYKTAGIKFNINSPRQLAETLFVKLGISGGLKNGRIKKTPTGAFSTNASELEKLKSQHKIINLVLKYRELAKLKSTYADTLPDLTDERGRVHTTFNQTGTATGRLSSQDPNLQNIPARGDWGDSIREAFVAERGFKFAAVDYSQIHLRIIAALADDKKMINAFSKNLDIHKFTASEVNNVPINKVTPEMRFAAKALNFGIIYGMGGQSFSEAAGITKEQADKFIGEYKKNFSGIARYIEKLKKDARDNGFASTFFGRRRYLPDLQSPNYMLKSQAERIAVNMPVQGLEADIIKKAMIGINNWIKKENLGGGVKMILQVHDELLFEIKENLIKKTIPEIIKLMEGAIKLKIPITVEARVGDNWGNLYA